MGTTTLAFAFGAQAQTAASEEAVEEIVVTGSRVITNGNDSPSPVTIVQTEDLLKSTPGNLAEALGTMPAFAGSRGTTSAPAVQGSQGGGNASANMLNLRNLGVMRALVLMDGYRIPPTTFNNAVDVDLIPQMLVQRVDLVTGGVSAVYGSDAVAGVVNFVLDKNFNGIRVEGGAGKSERGDAKKWDIGIAAGTGLFNDRGHIEGSYQHLDNSGILSKSERPWIWGWGVTGTGTAANPYTLRNNVRVAGATYGGVIINQRTVGTATVNGPLHNQQFASNGVLVPFVAGSPLANVGGDSALYDTSLMAPTEQDQFFVRYDHEISDGLRAYLQVAGEIKNDEVYGDNYRETLTLSSTNPFLPQAYRDQLANAAGGAFPTFRLSQLMGNFSRYHSLIDSNQWVYTTGFEGSLSKFKWGVNYSHGRSKLDNLMENNLNYQRLYAAVDAVSSGANTVCAASLVSSAFSDCVPINLFGPTAPSAAAMAYIMPQTMWSAVTTQDDVAGYISGSLFESWAGPVNMAVSAEWRKLSFRESSTSDATAFVDCTSLRSTAVGQTNCAVVTGTNRGRQGLWKYPFPATDTLSQSVKEGAFEMDVPLVKDAPFIQSLNANGAVRYTKYSLSGDYTTWKVGLDWHINDRLRFRATSSQDIRAPSLYELYVPASALPVSPIDLLTGPAATAGPTVPSRDQGDINLSAEVGKTLTGGFVITATPNLSFALDAYRIRIFDAIQLITGSNAANQQACYASASSGGPLSPLCSLQDRPLGTSAAAFDRNNPAATAASNAWTAVYAKYANIASIETYGGDLEVNYRARVAGRAVNLRLLTAYQPHAVYESPGQRIDQGGVAYGPTGYYPAASVRVTGSVHAQLTDAFSVDLLQRYRNSMKVDGDESLPADQRVWANNRIASFSTTNLTLSYGWQFMERSRAELSFNVSNLFDAEAPGGSFIGNSVRPGLRDSHVPSDDIVGRAYTLNFRFKM
jgi:iron complex outermembrane receptor protein